MQQSDSCFEYLWINTLETFIEVLDSENFHEFWIYMVNFSNSTNSLSIKSIEICAYFWYADTLSDICFTFCKQQFEKLLRGLLDAK